MNKISVSPRAGGRQKKKTWTNYFRLRFSLVSPKHHCCYIRSKSPRHWRERFDFLLLAAFFNLGDFRKSQNTKQTLQFLYVFKFLFLLHKQFVFQFYGSKVKQKSRKAKIFSHLFTKANKIMSYCNLKQPHPLRSPTIIKTSSFSSAGNSTALSWRERTQPATSSSCMV